MEKTDVSKMVDEGVLQLAECINKMMKLEKETVRLEEENEKLKADADKLLQIFEKMAGGIWKVVLEGYDPDGKPCYGVREISPSMLKGYEEGL